MSKRVLIAAVLIGLLLLGAGCSAPALTRSSAGPAPAAESQAPAAAPPSQPQGADEGAAAGQAGDTERMIVRTADMSLVVTDAAAAQESVSQALQSMDGYIADSSAWREGEQLRARMTVRLPADRLDAFRDAVKLLSVRVLTDNVRGQDVTEEYTDLSAQLVNLEATESELRELLSEVRQRTQKAEDILQVYRELTNIRGEIERVKGRIQFLSTMTSLATVNVELIPDVLAKPVVELGWRPAETVRNAGRSLVRTLQGLVSALIWVFIYVLPVVLVVAIPVVLLVLFLRWLVRRSRGGGRAGKAPTAAQ